MSKGLLITGATGYVASQLAKQQSAGATASTARAKAKQEDVPRRTVFRPVLANPLNVDW